GDAWYLLPREMPTPPPENALGGSRAPHPRAARYFLRDVDREVGIPREQIQGCRSGRLGDELSAKVGRPDRIRFGYRRTATVFVAPDRKRQAEGEDETDNAEERPLENAKGFSQFRLVLTEVVPARVPDGRRASDHRQNEEHDRPTRKREEHASRLAGGSAEPLRLPALYSDPRGFTRRRTLGSVI